MRCRDCDVLLSGQAQLCDSCREARKRYCIDCGAELRGHGNPIRCRSCACKENRSLGCYDDMFTEDTLRRKSESMVKTCSDLEYRANMSRLRRIDWSEGKFDGLFDEEHIESLTKSSRVRWDDPENRAKHAAIMADPEVRRRMSIAQRRSWAAGNFDGVEFNNRGSPSKIELEVLAAFVAAGVEVVGQYRPSGCSFTYDIYLPGHQALIEVDGEFWHYSKWAEEHGQPKRDAEKDDWALSNGFDIVRLPEAVLRDHGIVESVDTALGMIV